MILWCTENGGIGVLLPMTDLEGGKVVLRKILDHAEQHGLSIEADVFAYHGRLNLISDDISDGDSDSSFENPGNGTSDGTVIPSKIKFKRSRALEFLLPKRMRLLRLTLRSKALIRFCNPLQASC